MNNVIMRKITIGADYAPLVSQQLIASVTISAPPTNTGVVYLLGDTAQDVPLQAGEWHTLVSVNLSEIKVKGTPGDCLTLIGGTW